jgi:ribosome-associated protein
MMAKVRFAEKARLGLRAKSTSKVKPRGKVKPAAVKKAPAKAAAVKAKPVAKPQVAAKKAIVRKAAPRKQAARKPVETSVAATPALAPIPAPAVTGIMSVILNQLEDAKAEDIIAIDLEGKTAIADNMVVASGRSNRHVSAIADQLIEKLKAAGHRNLRVEGLDQGDWVLVDAGDVIIHLFRPEVRSFYNLEKLWSEHSPQEPRAT